IALFQSMDELVIERRHVAVLLRRQAFQPGFSRMHDERAATSSDDAFSQKPKRCLRVLFVDPRAALDRHGNPHPRLHRGDAIADKFWLTHETSAKGAAFHTLGRAADIEI